jgi:hypothetical protein
LKSGNIGPGRDLVHILRRQGHAHQGEGLALAVDDRVELVARMQAMGVGEGVADDDTSSPL